MKDRNPIALVGCTAFVSLSLGYVGAQQLPGVRSTELAETDLGQHFACLEGSVLRMTRHVVDPGAGSPEHSHRGRPELFYVVSGSIVEHQGSEARQYEAGDGFVSNANLSVGHRIVNESNEPAVVMDVQIVSAEH